MTTVREAANTLLSICDGAKTVDHAGFNKFDSVFVRDVLSKNYLTYNQETAIHKILLKYKVQLSKSFGINYDELKTETHKPALSPIVPVAPVVHETSDGAETIIMPFGKYKGMSLAKIALQDMSYLRWMAGNLDDGHLRMCADAVVHGKVIPKPKLQLFLVGGKICVNSSYEMKDAIKELPERKWNPVEKMWEMPLSVLRSVVAKFPDAELSVEIKAELEKASSIAKLANVASDSNLNIKFGDLELLPFQAVGVKFVENAGGRALIADEMGLGKTIQALAYIRLHPELRPVLIVCPASLKLNWRNEANKWLEASDKVSVISGTIEANKSVYIVNYDVLPKYETQLINMNFKVAVLDESHYIKNYKAKRTESTVKILANIPSKLLLTGTPVLNRPKEMFTQLNILDPVSYAKFGTFGFRYCDGKNTDFGYDFSGVSHADELNDRLKTIMVRRTKEQVLKELPDKRRGTMVVPLSNAEEYRKADNDFKKWLRETTGQSVGDAEHLVRIEGLKQLSVKGKMFAIIEYIHNFLESGQKLVVFAHHKFVVEELMNEFKDVAVSLTGETSMEDRQKAVDDFQHKPNVKLFIGNIQAAGVGITLTAASDVMFIELPWNPSQLYQAEDRVHRIGQKNAVNVMYMTGENTIDIDIAELIQKKAKVINAVVDGKEFTDFKIVDELLNKYKT